MDYYCVVEKQAVVIDLGRAFSKLGFATESCPRRILRTPLLLQRVEGPLLSSAVPFETWVATFETFLREVFFWHLHANPKERRTIIW